MPGREVKIEWPFEMTCTSELVESVNAPWQDADTTLVDVTRCCGVNGKFTALPLADPTR